MSELATNPEQQQFDIQSALSSMSSETARLREEVDQNNLAGTSRYPEWWYQGNLVSTSQVEAYLVTSNSLPEEVSDYYAQLKARSALRETISGWDSTPPIASLAYSELAGPGLVAKGLHSESPSGESMRQDMLKLLAREKECLNPELDSLVAYYNVGSRTGLFAIPADAPGFDGEVAKALRTENAVRWISYTEKLFDAERSTAENNQKSADWLAEAVSNAGSIDLDEAKKYTLSASKRTTEINIGLLKVVEKFDHFGADRLRAISKATNIYGVEGYSIAQLELMEKFALNPEAVAEQVKEHDVNLVLINRSGDHNGVLQNTAADVEDGETSQRNLFFEIDRLSDIYKTFVKLKKAGIKPSTLLMAAHSAPGQFMVSDDRDPAVKRRDIAAVASNAVIALANEQGLVADGDTGFSIQDAKGFRRLVDEFMQPSRGIDDNKQHKGRKKVIFQSCHMGSKVDTTDVIDGEKQSVGKESVVSQLAKSLVGNGLATLVDIYGAPGGIQMHATEEGLGYSSQPVDWDKGRPALKAVRARAMPEKVVQGRVNGVKLR